MVKIKTYTVGARGTRGHVVTLPKVWVKDLNLKVGDELNFYRTEDDLLIISKRELNPQKEVSDGE